MSGSTTANWWKYSNWIRNVARNARISNPTGVELAAVRTLIKAFWNPVTQTGTRSWLDNKFRRLAVAAATAQYKGDIDQEPTPVLVRMLEVIGRDLKKIPLTDAEKLACSTLINASQNRHLGVGPLFGGVIGDGAVAGAWAEA